MDITGKKFNRWTAIKFVKTKRRDPIWLFKCDCGKEKELFAWNITRGKSKSCGCYSQERKTTHGLNGTRFYHIWENINNRTKNISNPKSKYYSLKGIKCEWKKFEDFKNDMFGFYQIHVQKFGEKQTTIDRIDNNKNYCKKNCKWSTIKEQGENTGRNIIITHNGRTQILTRWAFELKIPFSTLKYRLSKYPTKIAFNFK
jgi:hypothetical protein